MKLFFRLPFFHIISFLCVICTISIKSPSNHSFLCVRFSHKTQRARPYYRAQKATTTTTASLHILFAITIRTGERENAFWKKTRQKYGKK
jgi:hypothetical protein